MTASKRKGSYDERRFLAAISRSAKDSPSALSVQWEPLDIPVESKEGAVGGDHGTMRRKKREAHDVAASNHDFGFRLRRQADDSALAAQRRRHVKIPLAIECQTLRAAQPAEEHAYLAGRRNLIHALEARCSGPGHKKLARRTESQVVGRKRRLERGENENLAVRTNLENRAAAVAYI